MTLGERIRQARESRNLSQEELAERLGISRQAVSKWENDTSVPHGVNRELLFQILEIEAARETEKQEEPVPSDENRSPESGERDGNLRAADGRQKKRVEGRGGWSAAAVLAVLLCVCLSLFVQEARENQRLRESMEATPSQEQAGTAGAAFYDSEQNRVGDISQWYNLAEIDSILVQWSGGAPDTLKAFYLPAGADASEQTELLLTKKILAGDTAALLSADMIAERRKGHIYFELDFGEETTVSETYDFFYEEEDQRASEPMGYILSADEASLTVDWAEWVEVPGSRAAELGIEENEAGFLIYNETEEAEQMPVAADCTFAVLDWERDYERKVVTREEFLRLLVEREGLGIPYSITVSNGEAVAVEEHYLP